MAIVEFLSYQLDPAKADRFHTVMRETSAPLHQRHGLDIVAFGPSETGPNQYMLIRAFASLEDRERRLDAFYAHPDWRNGPRSEIIASIKTSTAVLRTLSNTAVEALRRG